MLGHGHTDHRGTAPALGVPVLCHPDEVQDAEGSGGFRYWPEDLRGAAHAACASCTGCCTAIAWDGGPVKIAGTVAEGDEIAGFRVVHLPGHAPGLIALWRESDRLALSSDCFYTLDMWGRDCAPHLPEPIYNFDTEQARAEHAQARRAGARGGVARARQRRSPATCAVSSNGRPTPAERGSAQSSPRRPRARPAATTPTRRATC